jgi:hypothetical protein
MSHLAPGNVKVVLIIQLREGIRLVKAKKAFLGGAAMFCIKPILTG